MAAVQWDFLHGFVVYDLAHAGRGGIDEGGLGNNLDLLRGFANFQLNILSERGSHIELEIGDHSRLETER